MDLTLTFAVRKKAYLCTKKYEKSEASALKNSGGI